MILKLLACPHITAPAICQTSSGLVYCSMVFTVSLGFAFIFLCTVWAVFMLICCLYDIEFFGILLFSSMAFWVLVS